MDKIRHFTVTIALIVINVIVFLAVDLSGGTNNTAHMVRSGAMYGPLVLQQKEYYRIFTCMFLHFGIEHLLNNMLVLGVLGERLEPALGHVRFLILYLLGGVAGNLVSLFLSRNETEAAVAAGASGAVFAVMGGLIYMVVRNRGRFADLTMRRMLIMAAFSVYLGFAAQGVDNAAHMGGMAAGFVLAFILHPGAADRGCIRSRS